MHFTDIVSLISGVSLFLFGMSLMGEGLKKVAGSELERILYRLTSTPLKGILLGVGVTTIIQSSSATSVMAVGFVNSGMMKVRQAMGIILGSILGTSITGWIICLSNVSGSGIFEILSTDTLTALLSVAGVILLVFTDKEKNHNTAKILLGFSVLMFGIKTMTAAVYPLRESPAFVSFLTDFSSPLMGILAGLVFTAIIQSASAAVGILQALAVTGAVSFGLALPVIMGIAIGASVPVLLSAVGADTNGKRTAMTYLVADILGVVLFSAIFYSLKAAVGFGFTEEMMTMTSIALLNTAFRLCTVLLLAPFMKPLEKLICRLVPDKSRPEERSRDIDKLEERFLSVPALAIDQARSVLGTMTGISSDSVTLAMQLFSAYDPADFEKVCELESLSDTYEDKLGNFIVRIFQKELSERQDADLNLFLHAINDLERLGDHAKNLAQTAKELKDRSIVFSDSETRELNTMIAVVGEIVNRTRKAFTEDDLDSAHRIEPLEQIVDELCSDFKLRQLEQTQKNLDNYRNGFIFNDMLTDFERIGDHCSNVGIAVRIHHNEMIGQHDVDSKNILEQHDFEKFYEEYKEKFLKDI